MQPSMFNVRVPLDNRDDVFLMNTFTDVIITEAMPNSLRGRLVAEGAP